MPIGYIFIHTQLFMSYNILLSQTYGASSFIRSSQNPCFLTNYSTYLFSCIAICAILFTLLVSTCSNINGNYLTNIFNKFRLSILSRLPLIILHTQFILFSHWFSQIYANTNFSISLFSFFANSPSLNYLLAICNNILLHTHHPQVRSSTRTSSTRTMPALIYSLRNSNSATFFATHLGILNTFSLNYHSVCQFLSTLPLGPTSHHHASFYNHFPTSSHSYQVFSLSPC